MEISIGVLIALFIGYVAGRSNARSQVFRQIYGMAFLSEEQKGQVREFLIYQSGK
jgi:hypothetical protein